jgi:CDP-glucose 4,6-dehydratase
MLNQFWNHKNVLVTGATGLVGSWLVRSLLNAGARVVVLVRDADPQSELMRSQTILQTTVVNGGLEDFPTILRAINENEVDTVFHLGAQTIVGNALRSPLQTFESNIRGSYNLLEACRQLHPLVKRIIVASSDKAYGTSECLPYTEDTPLNGKHPYDVSKSCTDLIATTYSHTYNLPVVIARCGNIYGGGDLNWSRIIPGTIRSLLFDQPPVIRSNGLFVREYIYVQDAINAYLTLAQALDTNSIQGHGFNFGSDHPYSVREIVEAIMTGMGRYNVVPQYLNQAIAEIESQTLCFRKAKSILGWEPQYSLEDGLSETIKWYESYISPLAESRELGQCESFCS